MDGHHYNLDNFESKNNFAQKIERLNRALKLNLEFKLWIMVKWIFIDRSPNSLTGTNRSLLFYRFIKFVF